MMKRNEMILQVVMIKTDYAWCWLFISLFLLLPFYPTHRHHHPA